MNDSQRRPASVLDVVVYAPIGALVVLAEQLPQWSGPKRAQLQGRIASARMIGQFAVATARRELIKRANGRRPEAQAGPTATVADPTSVVPESISAPHQQARPAAVSSDQQLLEAVITGYDHLAASQVVERLEGLDADELGVIRAHEAAGRHRRTILHRIDQLLG
jgi:hypothetical protein